MPGLRNNNQRYKWRPEMLQLLIIGVWSFFPSYIGDYQNAQMRLACSSSVHHHQMPHYSPLEASSIPLLSPGSLLAPPPDNVQDAGSPVTHDDDVTDVTVQESHSHDDHHSAVISSLSLYIMIVVSYNTVTHRILQDSLMSELPHSRLLSPVAGDWLSLEPGRDQLSHR